MSTSYQIIFQNKLSDGVECEAEMVLMHSSDMKQLKLKPGGFITIQSGSKYLLCRAWSSKKSSPDVLTLNKLWTGNFGSDRKATAAICPSPRVANCSQLSLKLMADLNQDYSKLLTNYDFCIPLLKSALLSKGLIFNFSYLGNPLAVEIIELKSEVEQSSCHYRVNEHTKIKFDFNDANVQRIESETLNSFSLAGYSEQTEACLHHMTLGLKDNPLVTKSNTLDRLSFIKEQLFKPPKGLLLYGPPGTGKTRLMHSLVQTVGCSVVEVTPSILMSNVEGDSEQKLRDIFAEAQRLAPCCILMDNMDLLCAQRSKADVTDLQKRVVSCLLTLLDGVTGMERVFVIGTSSRPNDIDPALRRSGRIDKEIEIGVPTSTERKKILTLLLKEAGVTVLSDNNKHEYHKFSIQEALVKEIASLAHGMVGADLLLIIKEAFYLATKRNSNKACKPSDNSSAINLANEFEGMDLNSAEDEAASVVTAEDSVSFFIENDFREALASVSPSALREVVIEVPSVYWTDIGGMDVVKQSLKEVVEWPLLHPELFKSLNISPPKGVLLYGPPGCSKTLMAKALATESSMNFLAVRGPELLSKWLGDSEKAVQSLFRRARAAAPSIIFFDEIDALAGKRGTSSSGVSDRVLSQLLTELDGIQGLKQVIVIAATNRPDMLDAALIRPGRIDRKIYVPPPDNDSREQILRLELKKLPISSIISIPKLVDLTKGFSGAEIVAVCSEAAMLAVEEGKMILSEEHLLHAISDIKPQITQEMIDFYESFKTKI